MNGELAQLAALVAHGNAALNVADAPATLTFEHNSTLQYVNALQFQVPRGRRTIEVVATAPAEWFEYLRTNGTRRLDLVFGAPSERMPAHIAAGFAGATAWGVRASTGSAGFLWRPRWSAARPKAADNRIWSVEYLELPGEWPAPTALSVDAASSELGEVLVEAAALSREAGWDWEKWFVEARAKLSAPAAAFKFHPDMMPASGYTPASRNLLAASEGAFVFGGMGSWNDVYWKDDSIRARYDSVSTRLYAAVTNGIAAAVNSFQN